MSVLIRTAPDTTVETIYWIDLRYGTVGVGLRRAGDTADAWADVVGVGTLAMVWASGGGALTESERVDCLRCLAGAVYE